MDVSPNKNWEYNKTMDFRIKNEQSLGYFCYFWGTPIEIDPPDDMNPTLK
jgi:hypothetical protein